MALTLGEVFAAVASGVRRCHCPKVDGSVAKNILAIIYRI
jgi:hypothetical protein